MYSKNIFDWNLVCGYAVYLQGWTATTRHEVTRKRSTERYKHTRNLFRKNLLILDLKKAFYRQRTSESSYAKKENFDIDLLAISRNGDRKFMQSIRIMSRPPSKIRKLNQLKIYQNQTYRKDLSWLYWDNEPMVQERQQVEDQQFCTCFCSLSNNSK